jgi:hypothetical protein
MRIRLLPALLLMSTPLLAQDPAAKPKKNPNATHPAAVYEGRLPEVALAADKAFTHPGLLNTQVEMDFIREKLKAGEEPWASAFTKMKAHKFCKPDYQARPVPDVSQGPYGKPDIGGYRLVVDGTAAYGHAALWCITGEKAHADTAIAILNAYSGTLKSVTGASNQGKVLVGWAGCKFAAAGELLRHYKQPDGAPSGFADADAARLGEMFRTVFYPVIQDFQPTFNGNWDTAMINTMAAMGVYLDDHAMFNKALDHYLNSKSKGRVVHYIYPETGQCQETMRDQAHTQMGLGNMAAVCKTAQSQGLDLWSAADNRLALGYEYTAKYNLGYDVPCTGEPSADDRGKWQSIWELAHQHYAIEKGLPMPYVKEVISKYRPAGASDLVFEGWGTLLHYRGPAVP